MKHYLTFTHATPSQRERVRQLVQRSIASLDEILDFRSSAALLHMVVEENAARTLYRASATLKLPGRTLAAQEERHDLIEAVREVFAEIERQLQRHKDKLAHSDTYKRKARRQQLHRQKAQAAGH
jgi:ribosomal subunit interface protein